MSISTACQVLYDLIIHTRELPQILRLAKMVPFMPGEKEQAVGDSPISIIFLCQLQLGDFGKTVGDLFLGALKVGEQALEG